MVVVPESPAAADIETMLALMARFGEATGQPATRVRIVGSRDESALADADLIIVSAHTFGGPPGIAALLVTDLKLLVPTGGQERGYRGGTENLPAILGMAAQVVSELIRVAYPDLKVPFHARWRHFVLAARDLWAERAAQTVWTSPAARARAS